MNPPPLDSWSVQRGTILLVLLFAGIGTWPVCLVIFARYRRAVARGMQRAGSAMPFVLSPPFLPPGGVTSTGPVREIALVPAQAPLSAPLVNLSLRSIRRAQLIFAIAAVGYAVVAVTIDAQFNEMEWRPIRSTVFALVFSWPIVPTLIALAPPGRREGWLIWSGWLLVVLSLLAVGHLPLAQVLLLLALVVALPLVFVLAGSARAVRGAAWLVGPALVAIGYAIWELSSVILVLLDGVWVGTLAVPFIAKAVGALLLVALYAWGMTQLYTAKVLSEETLLLLQWWLIATITFADLLAPLGAVPAAIGMAPYLALLIVLLAGFTLLRPPQHAPFRLLLLRTFGARRRSTRLLRDVTRQWRWIGSVELITAPDLATESLDPDELLDFLTFRLPRRFVQRVDTIGPRLADLDLRPDRDGRYRVNELMCHDDTWRPTAAAATADTHRGNQ